jgi:hypothetical protein
MHRIAGGTAPVLQTLCPGEKGPQPWRPRARLSQAQRVACCAAYFFSAMLAACFYYSAMLAVPPSYSVMLAACFTPA